MKWTEGVEEKERGETGGTTLARRLRRSRGEREEKKRGVYRKKKNRLLSKNENQKTKIE